MIHLRPVELRDVPLLHQYRMDEEVNFWGNGGHGDGMPSYVQLEERIRNEGTDRSGRTFAIEVEQDGTPHMIGTLSFRDFDRVCHKATIGMMIGDKNYWNQGIGTQALQQFLRLLFTRYNLHRLEMDMFTDNKRAIRCYEKCGFVIEGIRRKAVWTINGYRDQVLMGLLREDWLKQQGREMFYLDKA